MIEVQFEDWVSFQSQIQLTGCYNFNLILISNFPSVFNLSHEMKFFIKIMYRSCMEKWYNLSLIILEITSVLRNVLNIELLPFITVCSKEQIIIKLSCLTVVSLVSPSITISLYSMYTRSVWKQPAPELKILAWLKGKWPDLKVNGLTSG